MDLIGLRYLKEGFKFYIFNIIDIGNHFTGVYPINNKAATSIVPWLIDFWRNGVVENFNDNITKYFLKQKFTSLEEM